MGAYQLLFSVTVEHMYFSNRICKSLDFVPARSTSELLNKTSTRVKIFGNQIFVFAEYNARKILKMHAEDGLTFAFKVFSRDPLFTLYTLPVIQQKDKILYFDNHQKHKNIAGRTPLHRGQYVSDEACVGLKSTQTSDILEPRDYQLKPCFIFKITVQKNAKLLTLNKQEASFRHFLITFATNQTYWKYYLLGDWAKRHLYIADLDNQIQFKEIVDTVLPEKRTAMVLQSTMPVQMHEQPTQRLQLRELAKMGDKILIKRLPNASVNHTHGNRVDQKIEHISEIFVN